MKYKIAVTGPESSGKTTLALALTKQLKATFTLEYARVYLQQRNGKYEESDLREIACGQLALEKTDALRADTFQICDTDMLVLKIWSEIRYGRTDPFIEEALQRQRYDLTLLCVPDIPWEPDPLRENPDDRMELLERYRIELTKAGISFVEIDGLDFSSRLKRALEAIHRVCIANPG